MKHNQILFVYCSSCDKKSIRNIIDSFIDISIKASIINNKISIKKINSYQNKSCRLQKGDFLIVIDNPRNKLFKNDLTKDNILYFPNATLFSKWLNENYKQCN